MHFGRSEKAASDEAFFCSCGCVPFDGKRNEGEQDDSGKQDDTNPDQIHRVEEGAQQDDIDRKLAAERNDGNENRAKAEPAIAFGMLEGVTGLMASHAEGCERRTIVDLRGEGKHACHRVVVIGQHTVDHSNGHICNSGAFEHFEGRLCAGVAGGRPHLAIFGKRRFDASREEEGKDESGKKEKEIHRVEKHLGILSIDSVSGKKRGKHLYDSCSKNHTIAKRGVLPRVFVTQCPK